jgi:hypothetical protein
LLHLSSIGETSISLREEKIRRGGKSYRAHHNFFAALRLCENKKEKIIGAQRRQAAKASGG